ncbi:acetyltransferase [Paracnuella aquatica]|uniref:acetyltransferase n=1 Tax=Paracnuella aquatica TaxID=2268757 RepID=UPI000DEFDC7E|nr:acetyltransferase [Paracnuella aquatica]RPD45520.1 acetyltransferase [Paracnuella aquatica]
MKTPLILIGGGGHCRSCIDVIESTDTFSIEGILDEAAAPGSEVLGYKVLGNDSLVPGLTAKGYTFLITVGHIKSAAARIKIFDSLRLCGSTLATVVASSARVSRHAKIGVGTIVMHGGQVNAGAKVGVNTILNTGSLVEHDAIVGDHVHLSTHAVVNGGAAIGNASFIGSNAVVSQACRVAPCTVIGAASVVIRNITEAGTFVGNPAKRIS